MHNKYIPIIVVLALSNLVLAWGVYAQVGSQGTLDSPAPPDSTLSYTLEDIYHRLESGAAGTQSTFTEPSSGPAAGTMHTLNDIMDQSPAGDNPAGATPTQVLTGTTYWSLRTDGTWGPQTGAMPDNGGVTYTPGTGDQTVAAGYHDGSGKVVGDPDLAAGNIAQGVDLFGVIGSAIVATGDAAAGDVLSGTTFSNAGGAGLTGTMPNNGAVTMVPTTTNQAIAAGYHNGSGYVQGDADLAAGNIKSGVNLFGVAGTYPPAGVPKTGQTTSYAAGDDGDLEKGVAWPIPRFTDNGNGTVTDNLSGLIWLKNANCFGARFWTQALTDTNTLASGSCGLSDGSSAGDWRLPNVREFLSLMNFWGYRPALPSGYPFTGVQVADIYWSSTTYTGGATNALCMRMDDGRICYAGKTTLSYYVWPVRGGQ